MTGIDWPAFTVAMCFLALLNAGSLTCWYICVRRRAREVAAFREVYEDNYKEASDQRTVALHWASPRNRDVRGHTLAQIPFRILLDQCRSRQR